jgi:glycerol-3-phosphate acyltransferase PlsY
MNEAIVFNPYLFILIPVAFLIGSIPCGLVFTKKTGVDIRTTGSKNIGATNVLRSAGKLPALLTLTGDMIKGVLPVVVAKLIIAKISAPAETAESAVIFQDLWAGLIGLSAVLGHMFSVFLKFRGGKGIATGFGVLLAYSPSSALFILVIWIAVVAATKYVSVGGMAAVSALPVCYLLLGESVMKVVFGVMLAMLVIYKHRSNISNLIEGTEDKLGSKK